MWITWTKSFSEIINIRSVEYLSKGALCKRNTIFSSFYIWLFLSISTTWEKVKEMGYRWENLEESARSIYFDW